MSRRKLEEIAGQSEEKKEPCPDDDCGVTAGIGVAFRICQIAEVQIEDVKKDLFAQKITVQDAIDKMKERLPDQFHKGLVEEVEQAMKEVVEKHEEAAACVSVFVQKKMGTKLDEWIDGRKKALENVDPNSEFAKGTRELIENLERSKQAIDKMKTCEAT